jgi:nucleoid-associated protein YgaU
VAQAPTHQPVTQPPVVIAPPPATSHPLQQAASRHGEQIVSADETGHPSGNTAARPQPVPMAALREYKAQSGDSLSKLAARFMGSASKANREAIIRVNPSLQQNPDKIVEGRTYVIPPAPAPAEAVAAQQPATPAPTPATPVTRRHSQSDAQAAAPTTDAFSWYTVKENENLWKIAAEQLGSGNAWTQIRDLNQDILKGEDQVRVNTRIRLPNKPVASAAH